MPSLANVAWQVVIWALFFASSVYGHVAIKLGTGSGGEAPREGWARAWDLATSPWTISGVGAWCLSGLLWVAILDKTALSEAMSVSALRYALVILAGFVVLEESIGPRQWVGMGLIAVGIALVKWKTA